MRTPIPADEKLAITLRFLATGESYSSLAYQFRVSKSKISKFMVPVCIAIFDCLQDEYLKLPNNEEEWREIAAETFSKWQFPNCIAAADGKHVRILKPANSVAEYRNYKGFFSIVLMAFANYNYEFLYVDVGCQGRISDGGVYRNTEFYKSLQLGHLNLPPPSTPPVLCKGWAETEELPYVFVADDGFSLTKQCMKPYPHKNLSEKERIFNYRLSRFRRISENTFGIWSNRFRVFNGNLSLCPEKAIYVTLAPVALHNLLRRKSAESYTPDNFVDTLREDGEIIQGQWREKINCCISDIPTTHSRRVSVSTSEIRTRFTDYFVGPGAVEWQWKHII